MTQRKKATQPERGELRAKPSSTALRVSAEGRMVIPAPLRKELGIDKGGELVAWREGTRIIVTTRAEALRELQNLVATTSPRPRGSAVDELIRERRRDAKRESKG